MHLGLNSRKCCYSTSCKCNKQTKTYGTLIWSFKQLQENIPHSRVKDLKYNIPSHCWSEYSGVKREKMRKEGRDRRRTISEEKHRRWKDNCAWGRIRLVGKGKIEFNKNSTMRGQGTSHQSGQWPSFVCEHTYLVKTALSFLASTVSRIVSFPAPVEMVSVVTVSLEDVDSVLFSSSSLSELLEEELSDATSGAFLATHTLQTHAAECEREHISDLRCWLFKLCLLCEWMLTIFITVCCSNLRFWFGLVFSDPLSSESTGELHLGPVSEL